MASCQLVHYLLEVHLYAVLLGRYIDVSLVVDAEVIDSPAFDVVELLGVLNTPLFHLLFNDLRFTILVTAPTLFE